MPRRLLDHLTKTESLPLLLRSDSGLEWLVLDKVDPLLDRGSFGGQVEQIVQRLCGCCRGPVGGRCRQGVLERAGVGDGDEQAGLDGNEGAQRGRQRGGGHRQGGMTTMT
jgi:hypothetical protein